MGLYQGPAKQEAGRVFSGHYFGIAPAQAHTFNTLNINWLELISGRLVAGWSASSRATCALLGSDGGKDPAVGTTRHSLSAHPSILADAHGMKRQT